MPARDTVIDYVLRYGGRCRDCADENGVCPSSGLPCSSARRAVEHVIDALAYGVRNGFLKGDPPPEPTGLYEHDIRWLQDQIESGHCGEGTFEVGQRRRHNARIERLLSALGAVSKP